MALAGWSWVYLGVAPAHLWSGRALDQLTTIASQAWPPRHDADTLAALARASAQTFQMSVLAMVVSTTAGMAVAVVAARPLRARASLPRRTAALLARATLLLCRAIPPPVWALVLLFVLFPGPLPGALALAAYNFGVLGRLMAEVIENLDPAPARALEAQGASALASWLYAVLPRAFPRFLAYGLYRWEVAIRETVIVGLVGAGGLGELLARQTAGFDWRGVTSTLVALIVLTFVVDLISASARRVVR